MAHPIIERASMKWYIKHNRLTNGIKSVTFDEADLIRGLPIKDLLDIGTAAREKFRSKSQFKEIMTAYQELGLRT